jgi:hypothetical protein
MAMPSRYRTEPLHTVSHRTIHPNFTMAALEATTQSPRVCAAIESFARYRARLGGRVKPGHGEL